MGIQARTVLVIILTSLVIILLSILTGIGYLRESMEDYMTTDMTAVTDIADRFISSELTLLQSEAGTAAERLAAARHKKWGEILSNQLRQSEKFIGMSVMMKDTSIITSVGKTHLSSGFMKRQSFQNTFYGEKTFSSTISAGNHVYIYLSVPIPKTEEHILILTLDGMYFSKLISEYHVWEEGHLFIGDNEGHVIADPRPEWVTDRQNFIVQAEKEPQYEELAAVIKRAVGGGSGIDYYSLDGVSYLCTYRPVSVSEEGWYLGITVPLSESPVKDVDRGFLLIIIVSLLLMIIAAIISSYFVRKPFEEAAVLIENAEADSQIKSSFLSNLSYEVRTPLDRILEHSEFVLADDGLSDETKDSIEIIFSSGMEILGTINDILDITKIESGNFEIYPDQYDTSDLINDMIALNIARIEEKPIVFKILVDERLPGVLYGDDLRVKQVFNNLLSNAFKYTDTGTVEWKITFEKEGDSVWIVSSVQDTGIGMAPEDVKSLFLDYNQEDFISNHKEEGAGLGLAITKRLVETMGGQITVESEQKKGSKFSVRMRQTFVSDIPVGKEIAEDFMGLYYSLSKHNKYMKMTYVNLAYEYILVVDNSVAFANEVEGMIRYWDRDETCGTEQVEVGIMDRERLLERFNGDKEVLYDVLKSYVSGTRVLLHDINKYLEDGELDKYIIAVHGIKGSSYGVFEQETGNAAAKLEAAAKAGDMDTIRDNHEAFAENTKGLLDMIEKNLDEINDNNRKPMKKMPDLERLVKLQNACQKYDIDGVDSIIEQLEAYHYEKGGEFVSWLREQVNHMDLDRIAVLDIQKISELWEDNGRSRKKVLLVHDSGTMLRNVKGWLEDKYDIFPVKSGTAAIKYLSKNRPDVIFLDDEMTAAGGMKISEIICEEVEYAEPLILSFTGKWNRESINKAIKEFF